MVIGDFIPRTVSLGIIFWFYQNGIFNGKGNVHFCKQ